MKALGGSLFLLRQRYKIQKILNGICVKNEKKKKKAA